MKQEAWLETHSDQILLYGAILCGFVGAIVAADSTPPQTSASTFLGFGIGAVVGFFLLAAILGTAEHLAKKYSPWRARRREQERAEIDEKIARGLFGWHPGIECDGKVNFDGYCEKCGQEGLAESSLGELTHAVSPLKFCMSLNSALRAIEKLWEMKVQVRVLSKTSWHPGLIPETSEYFTCTVKPPHYTLDHRPSQGSSALQAITRAIADFIDKESTFIRLDVERLQETGLGDIHEEIRKLREPGESDPTHDNVVDWNWDSADFMHSVRRFVVRLLDERDEDSLGQKLAKLERSLASLRNSLQAQKPSTLSCETIRDYTEALDLYGSIGHEVSIFEKALHYGPLDIVAGYLPHITEHPKWATSPEYLDPPPSLSKSLFWEETKHET